MIGEFQFHSVGQGLFYTGVINNLDESFVFVYDCGGSNKGIVYSATDQFIDSLKGKKIDLLVLSHLHEDHINGIEKILGELKPGGIIVMPYIDRNLQLLYQYQYSNSGFNDPFLSRFYDDPIGVMSDKTENEVSIYMVSYSMRHDFDKTYFQDVLRTESQEERVELKRKGKNDRVHIYLTNCYKSKLVPFWAMRITQPFFDEETYFSISSYLDGNKDLKDLLVEKESVSNLKSLNRQQNKSCLLMEHWFLHSNIPSKSILTGDLQGTEIQSIKKSLYYPGRPFVFQIPYHGADDLASVTDSVISVVSYGINNNHKHPKWDTIRQYLDAGSSVVGVNENTYFKHRFCFDRWVVNGIVSLPCDYGFCFV